MLKLLKRLGKYWWLVGLLVIFVFGQVTCDFFLPFFLGQIITFIQENKDIGQIALCSLYMLLVALLSAICSLIVTKISSIVTARMVSATRYDLYKKVGEFSTTEMNKFSVSSLVTRTTNDLTMVGNVYNLIFRFLLYGPLIAIAAMVLFIATGIWPLTLTVLIAVVLLIIFIVVLVAIAIPKYEKIQSKLDKVTLVSRENLEGLRVVRAYNAEDYQEKKFANVNDELMKTERFSNRALGLLSPGIMLIVGILMVTIYIVSFYIMGKPPFESYDYSSLSMCTQFAGLILIGFVMMVIIIVQLPRTLVCAKRINEVIETKVDVTGTNKEVETKEEGTIEFKDVSFSYPGAEVPVLNHISFKAKKGETIAFIGATGAGKTTLINLLPRFFDCNEGEVLVDGVNVKEYPLAQLFAKFGYVPQKGYLFHDSLLNNITIGKPKATPLQISRALEIAQAKEFVEKLPDGLDYEISQGGKNVSGGQRQRLCIARAIIMEPEIFIFDDSFSALDYKTDKVLRGEIKKQCAGTTNVIVAQRVGTIIDADQIIVLDEGNMVGHGTHAELLRNCPVYKEIALSQLSEEELEKDLKKGAK